MLISRTNQGTKKGFTLIEIICSVAVFILFTYAISSIYSNIAINKTYSNKTKQYAVCLEAIKNKLCYTCNNQQIEDIKIGGFKYINSKNINISTIKNTDIQELLSTNRVPYFPYIEITITENKVYEFNLILHFTVDNKEKLIKYNFVKGNY